MAAMDESEDSPSRGGGRSGKRIHREWTRERKRRGRTKKGCGSMVGRGGHPVICARRRSARGCLRTILGKGSVFLFGFVSNRFLSFFFANYRQSSCSVFLSEREGGGGGRTVFSFSLIVIVFVNQAPFEVLFAALLRFLLPFCLVELCRRCFFISLINSYFFCVDSGSLSLSNLQSILVCNFF